MLSCAELLSDTLFFKKALSSEAVHDGRSGCCLYFGNHFSGDSRRDDAQNERILKHCGK